MSERFEMRVSAELLARLDAVRGSEPRATWIKAALERALEPAKAPVVPARAVPGVSDQWNRATRLGPGS